MHELCASLLLVILFVVNPISTFLFFHWGKTTTPPAIADSITDFEALIGYNSTWCTNAYNHTFPDEYEIEYIKIKLCTNSSDADRIDAVLRYQQLVKERETTNELMTQIIAKLAIYDEQKIDTLTAGPLDVPPETKGCYEETAEIFSKVCIDLEKNPYASRFRNVFLHACEADWINPKSKIEEVFREVCAKNGISNENENKTEIISPVDLRKYEDKPSGAVQGVNSSTYYDAFLAMTSEDYVFEALKEQARSGYGSVDSQLAEAKAAFKLILRKRQFANLLITQLLTLLSNYDNDKKKFLTKNDDSIQDEHLNCYLAVLQDFTKFCLDPQLNPYAKRFRKILAHICEADWLSVDKVRRIFEQTCQTTDKKRTAILSGTF